MSDDVERLGGPTGLDRVRADERRRWAVILAAVAVGLLAAAVHWVGIVVGGALVSLPQRSLRNGVLAGFAFGVVCWLAFVIVLAFAGSLSTYLTLGQVLGVSAAIPLAGGTLGGVARGVL